MLDPVDRAASDLSTGSSRTGFLLSSLSYLKKEEEPSFETYQFFNVLIFLTLFKNQTMG
jgi:hypothetical protein